MLKLTLTQMLWTTHYYSNWYNRPNLPLHRSIPGKMMNHNKLYSNWCNKPELPLHRSTPDKMPNHMFRLVQQTRFTPTYICPMQTERCWTIYSDLCNRPNLPLHISVTEKMPNHIFRPVQQTRFTPTAPHRSTLW